MRTALSAAMRLLPSVPSMEACESALVLRRTDGSRNSNARAGSERPREGLRRSGRRGAATGQPKRRSRTVRDWLLLAFVGAFVVLTGLPAIFILVLDALPLIGDWLTRSCAILGCGHRLLRLASRTRRSGERQSTRVGLTAVSVHPVSVNPLKQSPVSSRFQYTLFALRSGPCG